MLTFVLVATGAYLVYLLYERWANDRARRSFQHVIHVNGIRGKTSVCRLIDAHLRGAGYRVFTKTTGSTPCYIGVDGVEHQIRRLGPASIGEQLRMIRRAHRQGAEILILECMAVQPELQTVAQRDMVKGDLNVITNVRYDHIFEMGEELPEIAQSLSAVIPAGGVLFTADRDFFPFFQEKCGKLGTEAILCTPDQWAQNENGAIACAIGTYLGVDPATFADHIQGYQEDFGAHHLYPTPQGGGFLSLFSANDPQSTRMLLEQYVREPEKAVFLYNSRPDRPDRLLLFIRHFFTQFPCGPVLVMGEGRTAACRLLRKAGLKDVRSVRTWQEALAAAGEATLVGVGNIKGQAYQMIEYFEQGGERK